MYSSAHLLRSSAAIYSGYFSGVLKFIANESKYSYFVHIGE